MNDALTLERVSKTYASGLQALKGISLAVKKGDFFALLGPNGAGKSTTIGIICSLVKKSSGKVAVFGVDIDEDIAQAKAYLGLVPQEFNFNIFEPIVEILINQAGYYGIGRRLATQRAQRYLRLLGLWEKRNEIPRELSGGMKRRLMIARALVHEPRLLILDEPTAGVDIEIRRSMWRFLQQINAEGTTIILTTHYLEEAESLCRNIAIIDDGVLVENTSMKKLLANLQTETFILDLKQPLKDTLPFNGYGLRHLDDSTLEVDLAKAQSLNELFRELSAHNIDVMSMRNKTNRLEQFFVNLVDNERR